MSRQKHVILSIDGGGVRGLIPLRVLESIAARMAHRGQDMVPHACFDLICGTSTGGLIAAGLAAPKPGGARDEPAATIQELRQFYETDAREIFSHSFSHRIGRALSNPFGLFDETYDARPFEKLLKSKFGWTSMASGLTHLVLTAYDIERRKAVFMSNTRQREGHRSDDYYLWQAVRATTAAPSFFEPAKVENLTKAREEALIDGGVFMSDPALAAYIEARKLGWAAEDITLISLGTGLSSETPFSYRDAKGWGALGWMQPSNGVPILSIFADGQAQTAAYQAECLFTDLGETRYIRLNGTLPEGAEAMDNARPGNITTLNGVADRIIKDNTLLLDEIAELLIGQTTSTAA
ncbi:patatin-like phospholipase family protein [Roseibium sp.]|uniref:patatin-like phospholipase family protein n=1 Tax=Roseibium sp. TaxID=1936156 RepID=UPI003A976D8E